MQRTIKCPMLSTEAVRNALRATAEAFANAANDVLAVSRALKTSNKVTLQHAAYRKIREKHGLSANLAIRAIARVAYAVKVAEQRERYVSGFKPTSIDYDLRIFAWRPQDESVSLTTVSGRIHVPLKLGRYQREALAGKSPTCARVVRQGTDWVIHIVVDETEPPKQGGPPLGIDLGIRSIATLSTGRKISGAKVRAIKDRYARIRASLQSKGTHGARRLLKRLSGRERRYIAWMNHNVSKAIIRDAVAHGRGILRFEDLRGIRARTKTWSRHLNRMISGWSFGELQAFSEYKALRAGLSTEYLNPAWTSETHHACGRRGVRSFAKFWLYCPTCDRVEDADKNAATNIEAGGVRAGEIPAVRNGTRIGDVLVGFFGNRHTSVKSPAL